MLSKRLLASIVLDKKKLNRDTKNSCRIECIPTIHLLTNTEKEDLINYLNKACDLLRASYIRSLK
jgi:hypothetical protein